MKVKELIEKLQAIDPELMVVTNGYEGGVNEVNEIQVVDLALNVHEEWYYGNHETVLDGWREYPNHQKAKAVLI